MHVRENSNVTCLWMSNAVISVSEFSFRIFRTLREIMESSLKTQIECTIGVIKL